MKAKIKRFEDIDAWQKARELTKSIYKITSGGIFRVIMAFEIRSVGLQFRLCPI